MITGEILRVLPTLPNTGIMTVFIKHTSAAIALTENADPDVRADLDEVFSAFVPPSEDYRHIAEGPEDMPAHIKTVMVGTSVSIPITRGFLNMGTWQGIYLCEFTDTCRASRDIVITVLGE